MFGNITNGVLQIVLDNLGKLLREQQPSINQVYRKMGADGLKLTMTVDLTPSGNGIVTEESLSYPLEPKPEPPLKQTVKNRHTINEDQVEMFEGAD
jgi:hypothetical protein